MIFRARDGPRAPSLGRSHLPHHATEDDCPVVTGGATWPTVSDHAGTESSMPVTAPVRTLGGWALLPDRHASWTFKREREREEAGRRGLTVSTLLFTALGLGAMRRRPVLSDSTAFAILCPRGSGSLHRRSGKRQHVGKNDCVSYVSYGCAVYLARRTPSNTVHSRSHLGDRFRSQRQHSFDVARLYSQCTG